MIEVHTLIKKIEQEFDDLPPGEMHKDSLFKEVLNWNSINSVVMSAMIEFEYNVLLSSDDFKKLNTVQDLADFIQRKKNA